MSIDTTPQPGYTIKLPAFEGPLDLLLHLIREHKVDIYDIPISLVADQYLKYLSLMESLDLNIAGEFFVMASTLLEIKSRLLLPVPPKQEDDSEEGVDPRVELVEKLLEYERFKNAASELQKVDEERRLLFRRITDELDDYDAPVVPLSLGALDLLFALQRMLADVGEGEQEVTSIQKQKISLRMKMREIWSTIKAAGADGISFEGLFLDRPTRDDIVMTFLALLELLRMGRIRVRQRKALAGITIWAEEEPEKTQEQPATEEEPV